MSEQTYAADPTVESTPPAPPQNVTQAPAPEYPNPEPGQAAASAPAAAPKLSAGQLVSYAVVDDAGNEHTSIGVVVEVFDVVDDAGEHTSHARVAHLPAALAISADDLTVLGASSP